jgi:hypothetical protein
LILATAHARFQHIRDVRRHAEISLGRFNPKPVGNLVTEGEGDVFHGNQLVSIRSW